MLEIRPFRPEDWKTLLDLANQAVPFAPGENIDWLEHRKAFNENQRRRRHYIATQNGIPAGYGCLEQQSDDPRRLRVYVVCSPEDLAGEAGSRLYGQLIIDAKELGAAHLWAREYQEDAGARDFFTGHGFIENQRFTLPGQPPMVKFILDLGV